MTNSTREIRTAAMEYASQGWPVLPLRVGDKEPDTIHGVKDATTDADLIERWWADGKPHNVGIAVPEWYVVIDVDPRHGGVDTARRLSAKLGALPATRMAETRDGGLHAWLRVPLRAAEIDGSLGPGIEVKKLGGYVLAPPSRVPAETPGGTGAYRWLNSARIATAPDRWVQRLRKLPRPQRVARRVTDPADARALAWWWCSVLRHTPEGHRNHQLFVSAVNLAEAGVLSDEVQQQLIDAATIAGLEEHEIGPTIASAMEAVK